MDLKESNQDGTEVQIFSFIPRGSTENSVAVQILMELSVTDKIFLEWIRPIIKIYAGPFFDFFLIFHLLFCLESC